eukprot:GHVS01071664.1.p1 GENE.GHVS01071664.1~~GHVS01071664.1.p1  ORF type:complete len:275 (+),score=9.87 GHVS01071664.1:199-1023(+)
MGRRGMVRSKSTGSVVLPANAVLSGYPYNVVHSAACRRSSRRSRSQPPCQWSRLSMDIVEGLFRTPLYEPQPAFLGTLAGCERKLSQRTSFSRRLSAGSCIPPSTDASPVLQLPHARVMRVTRRSTPLNSPHEGVSSTDGPNSSGSAMEFPTRRLFGVTGGDTELPVSQNVEEQAGLIRTSVQAARDSLSGFLERVRSRKSPEDCCRIEDSAHPENPLNPAARRMSPLNLMRSSSNYRHYVDLHTARWGEGSYDKLEVELEDFLFDGHGGCMIS